LVEEVERLGALLDAEEALAKVVLFTIVSELLVYESDEGSRSGKDASGYPIVVDGLVPSVGGFREVLIHEDDVGKVVEVVDEVGLVHLEFPGGVLGGFSVEFLDMRLGDLRGLGSRKSSLKWLLLREDYLLGKLVVDEPVLG
jgi:hypothetical protein